MKLQCIFVLYLIIQASSVLSEDVKVAIDGAVYVGTIEKSANGRKFNSFKGIPFAEPPIGENRFEPPIAIKVNGTIETKNNPPECAQGALGLNTGEEDCLYLNVFSPQFGKEDEKKNLPVIVWLHGGSFVVGSATHYNPQVFMNKDVVLVVPQYRLGMLGFFNPRLDHRMGNSGSLDQYMALKWIKKNIHHFNGDTDNIILAGDCAGGASALYHMISPLSNRLIQGVISLSGSPLSPWSRHAPHRRFNLLIANKVRCPSYDLDILIQCLKEIDISELMEAHQDYVEARDLTVGNSQLAPVVQEHHFSNVPNFIEEDPIISLEEGRFARIPVLLSVTRDVGAYLADMVLYDFIKNTLEDRPEFVKEKMFPMLIQENYMDESDDQVKFYQEFYLPNADFDDLDSLMPGISQMLGDAQYNAGIFTTAKYLSSKTPTRLMRFNYESGPKLFDLRHPNASEAPPFPSSNVGHGDELFFLFPEEPTTMNEEQQKISEQFLSIITDFAYGRLPENLSAWNKFNTKTMDSLIITPSGEIELNKPFETPERSKVLEEIFKAQFKPYIEKFDKNEKIKHDEL